MSVLCVSSETNITEATNKAKGWTNKDWSVHEARERTGKGSAAALQLPPELTRNKRFDSFWDGLPSAKEKHG